MNDPTMPRAEPTDGADRPRRLPKGATTPQAARPAPPPDLSDEGRFVTLAAVAGAHGVQGEVRLKLFTDDGANLRAYAAFDADGRTLTLRTIRPGPNGAVARFAEIGDRTAAEGLRGVTLRVPRDTLPPLAEGEYYHADLIGLACRSVTGETLGRVVSIENFGAGDVLEIERPDGRRAMAPMIPAAVPEWDRTRLVVDPAFLV